jgi:hypothetical protein
VDGWDKTTNTVFQFHGCFWHGDDCPAGTKQKEEERLKRQERTLRTSSYIRLCGHNLVVMWECQWKELKREKPEITQFLRSVVPPIPCGDWYVTYSEQHILHLVRHGKLFGMVKCDIHVPEELKPYFSEMQPIFKHAEMSREHLGAPMKTYAERENILRSPRRCLVGSFYATDILLSTPLLKWYLEKGLEVSKVHLVLQYTPVACFKEFGDAVTEARRQGDLNKGDDTILADTMKLLGNSGYGKTVTNKNNFSIFTVCDTKEALRKINRKWFRQLTSLDEDLHEVEEHAARIVQDLPLHIGFFVYNYTKLFMLQFYYDLVDKFVDRKDYQYVQMDTDSAYLALSEDRLEDVVKKDMRRRFFQEWHKWFPAVVCDEHRDTWIDLKTQGIPEPYDPNNYPECCLKRQQHDKRTPGLFKLEWIGNGVIALCSKTYLCFKDNSEANHNQKKKNKLSTKGISKRLNDLSREQFLSVLYDKKIVAGFNRGFKRHCDGKIYTYQQSRTALSYFYGKRKVLEYSVSTEPTDM